MKTARIVFMVLSITFLMFVVAPIASAQDTPGFLVWDGTILKLKTTLKGYYYSPSAFNNFNTYDHKISESESLWGIVRVVPGENNGNPQILIFSKGDSKECLLQETLLLQYVAGSQVEFVANFVIDDINTYASGLLYVKAKLEGDAIKQGGTISSVAAYAIERGFDAELDLAANGLTIKGNVEKKLGCELLN